MQQTELKAVVQEVPAKVGLDLANWNWKVVRRFVQERCEVSLSRSSCLNYLHRLGFVLKRPKKRLLKADAAKRETFVAEYAALVDEAQQVGAKVFCVDEAHFRADADLRGKWVLKGEPALVDSTSPRWGEKASYYSAVCLETGEVEWMELEGNSNSATSATFLRQLREQHAGPLTVIWDNSPAHRGDALRAYLATTGLRLRLVNLPGYSPDFNEAIGLGAKRSAKDWVPPGQTGDAPTCASAIPPSLGHGSTLQVQACRCNTEPVREKRLPRCLHPTWLSRHDGPGRAVEAQSRRSQGTCVDLLQRGVGLSGIDR